MTIYVADIASYQGSLSPTALLAAGFSGINVKISHGIGQKSVHPNAKSWLRDTRFSKSTFHYLTDEASGQEQAGYAYARFRELTPAAESVAHVVDVENPTVTAKIFTDYVTTMATLLGRPICVYSGAWFADSRPWITISARAPWLWAAPDAGYPGSYPGDTSAQWEVGYGGWGTLAAMQYRVGPISGIDVSQTAVRSAQVWAAMRGEEMAWKNTPGLENHRSQVNARFPNRKKDAEGTVGDLAHQVEESSHNPDLTGLPEWADGDSKDEVRAWDMDSTLNDPSVTTQQYVDHIRKLPNVGKIIRYMIYNRKIYSSDNGFVARDYTGNDPHTNHVHHTYQFTQAADENATFDFKLDQLGDTMSVEDVTAGLEKFFARTEKDGQTTSRIGRDWGDQFVPNPFSAEGKTRAWKLLQDLANSNKRLESAVAALAKAATTDVDEAALAAALAPLLLAGMPDGNLSQEEVESAVRNVLRSGTDGA